MKTSTFPGEHHLDYSVIKTAIFWSNTDVLLFFGILHVKVIMRPQPPPSRSQPTISPLPSNSSPAEPATPPQVVQSADRLDGSAATPAATRPHSPQHVAGLVPPVVARPAAHGAIAQYTGIPDVLSDHPWGSLSYYKAWAAQPGQSVEELRQRKKVVKLLTPRNFVGIRRWVRPTILNLRGFDALTELPEGLRVKGSVYLEGCTALKSLPEQLFPPEYSSQLGWLGRQEVRGDLVLKDCTSLTHLPEKLTVSGTLDLTGCTALTHLPERLYVKYDLGLEGCTALTYLPEGLRFGRDLFLENCTSLGSIPNTLLRQNPGYDLYQRSIYLTGSGIPERLMQRMRDNAGPSIHIHFDGQGQRSETLAELYRARDQQGEASIPFANMGEALSFWTPLLPAGSRPDEPTNLDAEIKIPGSYAQIEAMISFLDRLRGTADYQNVSSRPRLAQHILQVIDSVTGSEELADLCHERIGEALESCGDRVMWAMNQIQVTIKVHDALQSAEPAEALKTLGRSLLRLEVVHKMAAKKISRLRVVHRIVAPRHVDEIEVYLAYETRLANELQLPVVAQGMLFGRCAEVTGADLKAASRAAKSADANPKQVAAFLQSWAPWQQLDRRSQVKALQFDKLPPLPATQLQPDEVCVITQQTLAEMQEEQTLVVAHANPQGKWQIFAYEELMQWWAEHGTDPTLQKPLMLQDLRRVL